MGKRCLTLVLALLLALSLSACDSRPGSTDPTSSGGGSSSPPMPAPDSVLCMRTMNADSGGCPSRTSAQTVEPE